MILDLPKSLSVDEIERDINCDFRDVIEILIAYSDIELTPQEKTIILLHNLYVDNFEEFNNIEEAIQKAIWFVDWGKEENNTNENSPHLIDWEQDYNMIVSAVNQKIHSEVREKEFLHWWTFLGYFSERGECQYSTVVSIRDKLSKGRKLEKWEKEILRENRDLITLKTKNNNDFENELWGE